MSRRCILASVTRAAPSSGSGTMYIDDIRLYQAEFYEPMCPPLPPDLARNGKVYYDDLGILADNWLIKDYNVTPVEPSPGPVAEYRLEQNAQDSIGTRHGVAIGIKAADYD